MRISDWSSDVCSSDLIQLTLTELRDIESAMSGLPPVDYRGPAGLKAEKWIQTALLALANLPDYPAPVFMSLKSFAQVKASVFQVSRSPGTKVVYLGAILLVMGVRADERSGGTGGAGTF